MITFTRTHYIARIHTFNSDKPIVLCEEVLSCNIARSIDNPGHSFNLTLTKMGEYFNNNSISSDDWIEIFHTVTADDIKAYKEQAKKDGKTYIESKEETRGIEVTFTNGRTEYVKCKRRFLGRIERFPRDVIQKDGVTTSGFTISGSSWGMTIVKQPAMILPYFEGGFLMAKFSTSQYKIVNTPNGNIKKLLDTFWANEQFELPKSLADVFGATLKARSDIQKLANISKKNSSREKNPTIYDITSFDNFNDCDGEVANTQMLTADSGMFQLIEQYKNPLLNEFWTDLDINGNPYIVLREYPFSENLPSELDSNIRKKFFDIESVDIYGKDWTKISTGASGHERYNWFACTSEAHPLGTILSQKSEIYKDNRIQIDEESIHRYGLLQYEQGTMYSSYLSKEGSKKSFDQLTKYTKLVKNWYDRNHEFKSGSISTINTTQQMLGKRIIIHDIPDDTATNVTHSEAYYCTGVTESWTAFSAPRFDLTVVRGRVLKEKYGKVFENTTSSYFPSDNGVLA